MKSPKKPITKLEPAGMMRIGIVSDTHGLLRPEMIAALRGVSHILHAGDVGNAAVLATLKGIAPITAVRGNNDQGPWAVPLSESIRIVLGGVTIFMIHDLTAMAAGAAGDAKVIISGHSHAPSVTTEGAIVSINPGSAGPRRFRLPVTVAEMTIEAGEVKARIVSLLERPAP